MLNLDTHPLRTPRGLVPQSSEARPAREEAAMMRRGAEQGMQAMEADPYPQRAPNALLRRRQGDRDCRKAKNRDSLSQIMASSKNIKSTNSFHFKFKRGAQILP